MKEAAQKIGKYILLEVLGRGGMGTVYKAHDPVIGRDVALKLIHERALRYPEIQERFYREARSAGRLSHENIVMLYDVGDQDSMPYLVMELLDGTNLRHALDAGDALSLEQKLEIVLQICRGLHYAHRRGVIHRDIKPENIQLLESGRVKILDFGIARVESDTRTLTQGGIGTPHYMSPEQIKGERIDHRTDIFSFGALLYEVLTGTNPFSGDHVTTVIYKILHKEPEPIRMEGAQLGEDLQRLVLGCLEKEVEGRYADFGVVIEQLEQVLEKHRHSTLPWVAPPRMLKEESPKDRRNRHFFRGEAQKEKSKPEEVPAAKPMPFGGSMPPREAESREKPSPPVSTPGSVPEGRRASVWQYVFGVMAAIVLGAGIFFVVQRGGEPTDVKADPSPVVDLRPLEEAVQEEQEHMQEEKRRAEEAGASDHEEAGGRFAEGQKWEREGLEAMEQADGEGFERAWEAFAAAQKLYGEARNTTEQEAQGAKEAMDLARNAVYEQRSDELIAEAFNRVEELREAGESDFGAGKYGDAVQPFRAAEAEYKRMKEVLDLATLQQEARDAQQDAAQPPVAEQEQSIQKTDEVDAAGPDVDTEAPKSALENTPPSFVNLPERVSIFSGAEMRVRVKAEDPDGDSLAIKIYKGPAGIKLISQQENEAEVVWQSRPSMAHSIFHVGLMVSDSRGMRTGSFVLEVKRR